MTDISASRSWGGTLPWTRGTVVATNEALSVLGDDHVHVGGHVAVQLERDLVLAQRPDGILHVDLVAVDLHSVLRFERGRDVLVCDRAEGFVLGANLQPHH